MASRKKITDAQVVQIREMYCAGKSTDEIAAEFGIGVSTTCAVIFRRDRFYRIEGGPSLSKVRAVAKEALAAHGRKQFAKQFKIPSLDFDGVVFGPQDVTWSGQKIGAAFAPSGVSGSKISLVYIDKEKQHCVAEVDVEDLRMSADAVDFLVNAGALYYAYKSVVQRVLLDYADSASEGVEVHVISHAKLRLVAEGHKASKIFTSSELEWMLSNGILSFKNGCFCLGPKGKKSLSKTSNASVIKMPHEKVVRARNLYQSGMTTQEIGDKLEMSRGLASAIVFWRDNYAGVNGGPSRADAKEEEERRKSAKTLTKRKLDDEHVRQARVDYVAGHRSVDIADRFGVSTKTILDAILRRGRFKSIGGGPSLEDCLARCKFNRTPIAKAEANAPGDVEVTVSVAGIVSDAVAQEVGRDTAVDEALVGFQQHMGPRSAILGGVNPVEVLSAAQLVEFITAGLVEIQAGVVVPTELLKRQALTLPSDRLHRVNDTEVRVDLGELLEAFVTVPSPDSAKWKASLSVQTGEVWGRSDKQAVMKALGRAKRKIEGAIAVVQAA